MTRKPLSGGTAPARRDDDEVTLTRGDLKRMLEEHRQTMTVQLGAGTCEQCRAGTAPAGTDTAQILKDGFADLGARFENLVNSNRADEDPDKEDWTQKLDAERAVRRAHVQFGSRLPKDFDAAADDLTVKAIVQAAMGGKYRDAESVERNMVRLELMMEVESEQDAARKGRESDPESNGPPPTGTESGATGTANASEHDIYQVAAGGFMPQAPQE